MAATVKQIDELRAENKHLRHVYFAALMRMARLEKLVRLLWRSRQSGNRWVGR